MKARCGSFSGESLPYLDHGLGVPRGYGRHLYDSLIAGRPGRASCELAHQRLEEIGRTMLIARTPRQLFGAVVLARIAQDDHLEEEEAFILPVIRRQLSTTQQEEVIGHLLIDQEAEAPRWHLDWLREMLPPREGQCLVDLAAQIHAGCPRQQRVPALPRIRARPPWLLSRVPDGLSTDTGSDIQRRHVLAVPVSPPMLTS
jgi:hypothetical protein